ncbi:MAG TPA: 1-deoxy-D-xylulose-5-phosphate synthase [Sediminispirochaeta sp.]|nr:1-deoxy-D-xylulose-5-phosphate synthase [Sediminispirochaeta sp.]
MSDSYEILSKVNSPEDLRGLGKEELPQLAEELRRRIIEVVMSTGGHLASNLGVVELTLALHRVFESPRDMIFWDVGHQCYTHKILTGRNDRFDSIRQKGGLSGFPKRSESEHDHLETGHASTAISAGIGALTAKRALGDRGKVVVVVGDGALTGGMAYEGLNYAGHLGKDLIVIYNDNKMSISKNIGGLSVNSNLSKLSNYVTRLTLTPFYQKTRDKIDRGIQGIPVLGCKLFELMVRIKRTMKAAILKETIFSEMGFDYIGPVDGHSLSRLVAVLRSAKKLDKPVVIHTVTRKGKGYQRAENNPSRYHGVSPMVNEDDKLERKSSLSYSEAFASAMMELAQEDPKVVAITAAMADGTGFTAFKERFPKRFYDVGIAEQHAVTFSAGLAIAGLRPVTAIYSTFMQRAVDQVIHDLALPGLPVVIAMDRSGLVSDDGETHQGLYDIPLFRSVPGLSFLAPGDQQEMKSMLRWALQQSGPVMLRYPKDVCPARLPALDGEIESGRGVMVHEEEGDLLFISLGAMTEEVLEAVHLLALKGIPADLYHLRFIKPLDEEHLSDLISRYPHVLLVEDGTEVGGVGEQIAGMITRRNIETHYRWMGVPDSFLAQASRAELLREVGLDRQTLADRAREMLSQRLSVLKPGGDIVLGG